jgi:ornithine cyclodeaminase
LRYLTRADVTTALAQLDPVEIAARTLADHADGRTELPEEAYLGWRTADGYAARSLALPGLVNGDVTAIGTKIINASLGNTARGVPRADGLMLMYDSDTAHPVCVMDAALISATRTAAVSAVAARTFGPAARVLALIGCGRQAEAHLDLLSRTIPTIEEVRVHDVREDAVRAFAERHPGVVPCASAEEAVRGADLVVPLTIVSGPDEGYLALEWLEPDAVVIHVSLDDLLPEVVEHATTVVVDDWGLVSSDHRRLLGRMHRDGLLLGPGEPGDVAAVTGELGDYLVPGGAQAPRGGLTVVNPFGMAVQDVALAGHVLAAADESGLGITLPR